MKLQTFGEPVAVLVGLGFVRPVVNVMAAYQMMSEWPTARSDLSALNGLKVCRDALNGTASVSEARQAFIEFAAKSGILMEAVDAKIQPSGAHRHTDRPN